MSRQRRIPSVDRVLQALGSTGVPRATVVALVRRHLDRLRRGPGVLAWDGVLADVRSQVQLLERSRIQPVVNGTGVLLHTNLGRAPLATAAVESLQRAATQYTNLEFDLVSGTRGSRAAYLESQLALLCRAPAATVVNNGAAALVLVLRHLTRGDRREVLISRGELLQIGGGFRIPEILEASGAQLREVGTTNQTSVEDYRRAITRQTALLLKVHRSNFFLGGFVESPATEALAALAHRKRLPLVEDLGSGAVVDTATLGGIEHEPTPAEVLRRGVDLVCFSGDKLLGGPQAGILAGKASLVAALKREPFFRALRCDKLVLSALQATTDLYLQSSGGAARGAAELPVLQQLRASLDSLRERAVRLQTALTKLPVRLTVGTGQGRVGGGTLPRVILPSVTLDLQSDRLSPAELAARLRAGTPPVIGYIGGGRFRIDLRTVFPRQDAELRMCLERALATP